MGSNRHHCMGTLFYWMGYMGPGDQRPAMMTVGFRMNPSIACSGMMTVGFGMNSSIGCSGMMILGFGISSNTGPWEAAAWALQSHVVRCSDGFAFRLPCALFLCAPFSFLNRYHLFVVVPHPD